jgi:chromosome segregation ATPase
MEKVQQNIAKLCDSLKNTKEKRRSQALRYAELTNECKALKLIPGEDDEYLRNLIEELASTEKLIAGIFVEQRKLKRIVLKEISNTKAKLLDTKKECNELVAELTLRKQELKRLIRKFGSGDNKVKDAKANKESLEQELENTLREKNRISDELHNLSATVLVNEDYINDVIRCC